MQDRHYGLAAAIFPIAIVVAAAFVAHRFFLPLAWGAILCIATWPLYLRVVKLCGQRLLLGAIASVAIVALLFFIPLGLFVRQAMEQAPALAELLARANTDGLAAPEWLQRIPLAGGAMHDWWQSTLAQPHGLSHVFQQGAVGSLHSAKDVLRSFGAQLMHRTIDIGFAFLFLFFFYKDGQALMRQITAIGQRVLGLMRWERYAAKVPAAIRATVNGLVLVGLAEGFLLGIGYEVVGLPSAALWAAATGVLGMIPFGAPLIFLAVAILLMMQGHPAAAAGIAAWGAAVLFVADHFVRPKMIGTATQLPFAAVLIGILGGVETMGLVGLFLGPVAMTLFVTLWNEAPFGNGIETPAPQGGDT